jgi:RNA polymerase sigma-70 factor (ECF subfamily)
MSPEQAREFVTSVFEGWGKTLLRHALLWTRQREVSEEIVQEAFLSLYLKVVSGNEVENPRAFTLAAVRNLIRKHHRDRKDHLFDVRDCAGLQTGDPGIEAHLAALDILKTMLEGLSEREEEVLLLRMESLRYQEIAQELGISTGAVATLLSRAIQKIKRLQRARRDGSIPDRKRGALEQQPLQ